MARNFTQNELVEKIVNRAKQLRDDNVDSPIKHISVKLYDIDQALNLFFEEVINPTVLENNESIKVPVIYGSPERWKSMKKDGYFKDVKGKLVYPLIMYRRNSINRFDQLTFPRIDDLYIVAKNKWGKNNIYDRFNMNNESKSNTYSIVSIPNYVVINYECTMFTAYVEQINSLIEKIAFVDGVYWGHEDSFKFRTFIDSFDTPIDMSTDTERIVKCSFTLNTYGYILPEHFNNKMNTRIDVGYKKISFDVSANSSSLETVSINI